MNKLYLLFFSILRTKIMSRSLSNTNLISNLLITLNLELITYYTTPE